VDEKLKLLQYYRYRTARPSGGFVIFPREPMRSFEEILAKMAGVRIDNHTCYLVEFSIIPSNHFGLLMIR